MTKLRIGTFKVSYIFSWIDIINYFCILVERDKGLDIAKLLFFV